MPFITAGPMGETPIGAMLDGDYKLKNGRSINIPPGATVISETWKSITIRTEDGKVHTIETLRDNYPGPASAGETAFRAALRKNGVPEAIIDIIVDVARRTPKTPATQRVHSWCYDWAMRFMAMLRIALAESGYKDGLAAASIGGIVGAVTPAMFDVPPFATDNTGWISGWYWQYHTVIPIVLADGTVVYVDGGTLSRGDVTSGGGANSPF